MNNNTNTWSFHDGLQNYPCMTFPYAYRHMFNALKKGVEAGLHYDTMLKRFKIISPIGKEYSYAKATELAQQQGLLTPDGSINSREFKKKNNS
jgi:hypothetical protein